MSEIEEVLDAYFRAWNIGFDTKDPVELQGFMSKDFTGYWAHAGMTKTYDYDFNYDLAGVLGQYEQAEKNFEILSMVERNDDNYLVMGREQNIVNGSPATAMCMFVWRREDGELKLLREYIELER
ncbi:hypothetical protein ACFOZY_00460 [Chungangia koreensis]|uniref:SnoaL-like domain-containing protein n=1 Tax=Chungangia koreensis TaxID=752657 RepID=A0ABV8WZH8_9LACT